MQGGGLPCSDATDLQQARGLNRIIARRMQDLSTSWILAILRCLTASSGPMKSARSSCRASSSPRNTSKGPNPSMLTVVHTPTHLRPGQIIWPWICQTLHVRQTIYTEG